MLAQGARAFLLRATPGRSGPVSSPARAKADRHDRVRPRDSSSLFITKRRAAPVGFAGVRRAPTAVTEGSPLPRPARRAGREPTKSAERARENAIVELSSARHSCAPGVAPARASRAARAAAEPYALAGAKGTAAPVHVPMRRLGDEESPRKQNGRQCSKRRCCCRAAARVNEATYASV